MSYLSSAGWLHFGKAPCLEFGIVLDFSGLLSVINSHWAVSDETPDVMQNMLLPLPSAGKPEVSVLKEAWWPFPLCALTLGEGRQAGVVGISEPALGFSHPQQIPCVVMEEFPGEPLCVPGIWLLTERRSERDYLTFVRESDDKSFLST